MILSKAHGETANRLPVDQAAFRVQNADDQKTLLDLASIGFVHDTSATTSESACRWITKQPAADRALLMLLARFDLHLEIALAEDETVWIAAAVQEHSGAETHVAFSGTGFRPQDAVRSCLGEFAEYQSWLYRPEDSSKHCDRHALGARVIDAWDALGFTSAQRHQRSAFNTAWRGYDSIPEPHAFDGEIDWTAAHALSDSTPYWVPSQLCFGRYGERAECSDKQWRGDSNGCAAGQTRQQALAHALLELVERDATGIWWYGRIPRPAVPQSLWDDEALRAALMARKRMGQEVRLLDLTHDLEIPVVAAILADADGSLLGLGFGCHFDPLHAIRSAYREMCQMALSIAFAKRRVAQAGNTARPEDCRLLDWLASASHLPHLRAGEGFVALSSTDVTSDEEQVAALLCERLRRAGLRAYRIDLERPEIGVPAVRAFVPGLCHFKPRLGVGRLVEVPRALRWREPGFGPQDLNDLPLLI